MEAESKRGRTEGVTHGDKYSCRFCICVIVPSQQNHTHFLNNWCSAGSGYVVHRVCSVVLLLAAYEKSSIKQNYTCASLLSNTPATTYLHPLAELPCVHHMDMASMKSAPDAVCMEFQWRCSCILSRRPIGSR